MSPQVLVAMPAQRRLGLLPILEQNGMEVHVAGNFRDARQKLAEQSHDLLFVDAELPGGSWQELVEAVSASGTNCEVIVCSRCGDDRLWAEVLQCGAYDLIPEPFDEREVARIAQCAMDSHYLRRFGRSGAHPTARSKAS
ncbi:MAG: response regulator [Terriglobia bacterium]